MQLDGPVFDAGSAAASVGAWGARDGGRNPDPARKYDECDVVTRNGVESDELAREPSRYLFIRGAEQKDGIAAEGLAEDLIWP